MMNAIVKKKDVVKPVVSKLVAKLVSDTTDKKQLSAKSRISSVADKTRQNPRFTHFLSIPMNEKNITGNYEKFKHDVLHQTGDKGVVENVFQKSPKMHITLGMLKLVDDRDVRIASETLEECKKNIIIPIIEKHGPITIKAQGLGYFSSDVDKVRVLYSDISTENDVLHQLVEKTQDCFAEKGLLEKEDKEISLHLTLMNTKFVKPRGKWPRRKVERIDATNIIRVHKDYFFGESLLSTVHICHLGPLAQDGYYRIISKIDLTGSDDPPDPNSMSSTNSSNCPNLTNPIVSESAASPGNPKNPASPVNRENPTSSANPDNSATLANETSPIQSAEKTN